MANFSGIAEVRQLLVELGEFAPRALSISLNKTRVTIRKESAKQLKSHLKLKSGIIKKHIFVKAAATKNGLFTGVIVSGYPLPILHSKTIGNKAGYKATVLKRGAKFTVRSDKGREHFRHAWLYKGRIFIKKSKTSQKIKSLYGPSIPNALEHAGILEKMEILGAERLVVVLDQQATRFLGDRN